MLQAYVLEEYLKDISFLGIPITDELYPNKKINLLFETGEAKLSFLNVPTLPNSRAIPGNKLHFVSHM